MRRARASIAIPAPRRSSRNTITASAALAFSRANRAAADGVLIGVRDGTGSITLPEGTEMCMPGDNTTMTIELIAPIAMDEALRFAIREGGRTVGAGRVTKILK